MTAQFFCAKAALAAGGGDFPGDSPADPAGVVRSRHRADEFMPQNAPESPITLQNFHVGLADARQSDFDYGPSRLFHRSGIIFHVAQITIEHGCSHD